MKEKSSALVFFVNTAIIVGVIFVSSFVTQKTIYDRFIVKMEGVKIIVSDYQQALHYYGDVLNFSPIRAKGSKRITGFRLPDSRKLILDVQDEHSTVGSSPNTAAVLRVRNNILGLHREIIKRSDKPSQHLSPNSNQLAPGATSEIETKPWGLQFAVKDYEGNQIIFYYPQHGGMGVVE